MKPPTIVVYGLSVSDFDKISHAIWEHEDLDYNDEESYGLYTHRLEQIREIILNKFTKQQREIFLMYFQYKLRQQYIAKIMKISQAHVCQCVKKCVHKIKKNIKLELKRQGELQCQKIPKIRKTKTRKTSSKSN